MNDSSLPVVIYGPQGCGKTIRARQLMALFGCTHLVDGWCGQPLADGALALTNMDAGEVAVHLNHQRFRVAMPFDLAVSALAGRGAEQAFQAPVAMEGAA